MHGGGAAAVLVAFGRSVSSPPQNRVLHPGAQINRMSEMLLHYCTPDARDPEDTPELMFFAKNQLQECYFPAVVIKNKLLSDHATPGLRLRDRFQCGC